MALMINDECAVSGAYLDECPNEAIPEGDPFYVNDPDKCTECVGFINEPQCLDVCTVDTIVPNPDHVETKEDLLEKKKRIQGE